MPRGELGEVSTDRRSPNTLLPDATGTHTPSDAGLTKTRRTPTRNREVPGGRIDNVHFSVTTPMAVEPGGTFLLDVWAHLGHQQEQVLNAARQMRSTSEIFTGTKGPVHIARGTELIVRIAIKDLLVDEPEDTILWEGEVGNATFPVQVPDHIAIGTRNGQAYVYGNSLQVALVRFVVNIGMDAAAERAVSQAQRHQTAFASYATKDNDSVLARIQGMQKVAPQLEVFFDKASLRSGQLWAAELYRRIPASDVFYLFWSAHARESEWVEKEWRCALSTRGIDFIDPVPLVSPYEVPPPTELAEKHFNDWVLAYMRARGSSAM